MPEFAQIAPYSFWVAANDNQLADGLTCTELQLALPRELRSEEHNGVARELTGGVSRKRLRFIILKPRTTSGS